MASTRNLMKFTDIVRDHYRGPAYGQEFTTWYTKVQHGFSTAQVPESAQVDHLVRSFLSPPEHFDLTGTPDIKIDLLRSSAISENVPDLSQ